MCFVSASLTATIGYRSTPFSAIARSLTTPVVVSSVPPITSGSWSWRDLCSTDTRSAPSSIVNDGRSEEHTSELQSHLNLVCRLLLEKKKNAITSSANKGTDNICSFTSSAALDELASCA